MAEHSTFYPDGMSEPDDAARAPRPRSAAPEWLRLVGEPDHAARGPGPEAAGSAVDASPPGSGAAQQRRAHTAASRPAASRWAIAALVIAFYACLFALAGPAAFVAALVVGAVGMALVGAKGSGTARARLR